MSERNYTEHEIEFLKSNAKNQSVEQLAATLNRTAKSIRQKLTKLFHGQLKRDKNGQLRCSHGIRGRCFPCNPEGWAMHHLSRAARTCRVLGYRGPRVGAEELIALRLKTTHCGCGELLDWVFSGRHRKAPYLHHDHETGFVFGFIHHECNTVEGLIAKVTWPRVQKLMEWQEKHSRHKI